MPRTQFQRAPEESHRRVIQPVRRPRTEEDRSRPQATLPRYRSQTVQRWLACPNHREPSHPHRGGSATKHRAVQVPRDLPGLGFDVFPMPSIWMLIREQSKSHFGRAVDQPVSPIIRTARFALILEGLPERPFCSGTRPLLQPSASHSRPGMSQVSRRAPGWRGSIP